MVDDLVDQTTATPPARRRMRRSATSRVLDPTARGNSAVSPTSGPLQPGVGVGEGCAVGGNDEGATQRQFQRPDTHAPLTAAITGLHSADRGRRSRLQRLPVDPGSGSRFLKSTPALNTGSVPVSTIAVTPRPDRPH